MASTTSQEFIAEEFFAEQVSQFTNSLAEIEERVLTSAGHDADTLLEDLTCTIHTSRAACQSAGEQLRDDPDQLREVQARFRDEIAHWFDQSWFMHRAKTKPRGYPGDFEMLTAIYEGLPKSSGFGELLDRYFLKSDLAKAVCSRLDAVQKFLIRETLQRAEKISILNVASGPGREYSSGFRAGSHSVALKCVDTDADALQYLREHIDPEMESSVDVTCYRYNALRMASSKANRDQFGESDIIYSVGLCDYIPDRHMIKILQGWRESVSRNGIVYVAFKDARRYVAAEYQWHVDWHFFERTESDCRELFSQAGYDMQRLEMFRDDTGIIMNFVARQPSRQFRIDPAENRSEQHLAPETSPTT